MNTPNETRVTICKLDAKRQIAFGAVYMPYVPDSQGDFMTPEEIERVAHNFLKKGAVEAIDTEHNLTRNGSVVVESFISREGDPDFPVPGSWVLGVHIPDKAHWAKAESGEIGGFSMYGTGRRVQRVVEIEVPDDGVLFGKTEATLGQGAHEHVYALDFNDKGGFLGGETDEVNGHTHLIKKGTVTEPGPDGHRHRFNFVDTLAKGCGPLSDEQKGWKKARENMKKGDFPGHPFRGNQYTDGEGGGTSISNGGPEGGAGGRQQFRERVSVPAPGGSEWDSSYDAAGSRDGVYAANVGAGKYAARDRRETDLLGREAERSEMAANAREAAPKQVELTPSGHRPLSTIAREIRRDWGGKVHYSAKPYLEALGSMYDVRDKYYDDSGTSVVAYLLGNMHSWRGPKAKEIKAELNKILKLRKADMTEEDMPEPVAQQKEVRCKKCQTPKACGKAGRCLISYEADEDEDDEESED